MRKPGSKGAPTAADLKNSQNEEYTGSDPKSNDKNNPLSRMDGTRSAAEVYAGDTPNQKLPPKRKILGIIKKTIKEELDPKIEKGLSDLIKDREAEKNKVQVSVHKADERTPTQSSSQLQMKPVRSNKPPSVSPKLKEEVKLDKDKLSDFKLRHQKKETENQIKMAEKGEPHPATEIPADFLSRKEHAKKYTPNGTEKTVKHGDGFGNVQQHLRGTLSQQVHSNQGGKFNIQKNK